MIPLVGMIVATYAVARLIQVPVEASQAWKGRLVVLWLVSIPAILVTAGYNDTQVGYFEPAKWVAKLRRNKTDQNLLLLRTNMGAGHAGDSGRFGRVEQARN